MHKITSEKVRKARLTRFKPKIRTLIYGILGIGFLAAPLFLDNTEAVPAMTFEKCVAQRSTHPHSFEEILRFDDGKEIKAQFTLGSREMWGNRRWVSVKLYIPNADRIIDIDVIDSESFAVTYAMGETVSVQIVGRRMYWKVCDREMYINDLVAVPAAH